MDLEKLLEKNEIISKQSHSRLEEICSQSNRLDYFNVIRKINILTDYVRGYRLTVFITLMANTLINNYKASNESWDLTKEEIDIKYINDKEYFESIYEKCKEHFDSLEDCKENVLDWMYTHCLDSAYYNIKDEYEFKVKYNCL